MLHGGAERGLTEVDDRSASLRRTRWMYRTIHERLAHAGVAAAVLQFSIRGWNAGLGREPSPIADARWALDGIRERYDGLPVVLLGHSMGARTSLHVADDPSVVGVVGLAPWFPADEDVSRLAGVHLTAAHGARDRITSARQTRRLLDRAAPVAASTRFLDMGSAGHYMLTHVRAWNRTAIRESLAMLD
jgi:fermentation-respiration switch protein FrsA (DUF1100 family)